MSIEKSLEPDPTGNNYLHTIILDALADLDKAVDREQVISALQNRLDSYIDGRVEKECERRRAEDEVKRLYVERQISKEIKPGQEKVMTPPRDESYGSPYSPQQLAAMRSPFEIPLRHRDGPVREEDKPIINALSPEQLAAIIKNERPHNPPKPGPRPVKDNPQA